MPCFVAQFVGGVRHSNRRIGALRLLALHASKRASCATRPNRTVACREYGMNARRHLTEGTNQHELHRCPNLELLVAYIDLLTQTTKSPLPAFGKHWALFLDVDGTLVDFVDQPDQLKASPELVRLLRDLDRLTRGALILVSGRTIASVDAIFEPLRLPTAGLHGQERRDTRGHTHRAPADERALGVPRERFHRLTERYPGSFVEEKGPAIAFHYRQAPSAATSAERLASELEHQLPEPFCVQRGKMVIEIRACDHSKGTAIESFMSEPGFEDRIAVFVGDDATDEYGFQWVNEHDGVSIKVGPGDSSARFRIEGVNQVMGWLEDYVRALLETTVD